MTLLDDCLCGRSQHLTFARRELLQNIASAALLFFASRRQSIPAKYPAPQFLFGDKVASYWPVGSYNDGDVSGTPEPEIGEIVGICWHPINRQWEYQVNWVDGNCDAWAYPCFDGDLCDGSDLERLP